MKAVHRCIIEEKPKHPAVPCDVPVEAIVRSATDGIMLGAPAMSGTSSCAAVPSRNQPVLQGCTCNHYTSDPMVHERLGAQREPAPVLHWWWSLFPEHLKTRILQLHCATIGLQPTIQCWDCQLQAVLSMRSIAVASSESVLPEALLLLLPLLLLLQCCLCCKWQMCSSWRCVGWPQLPWPVDIPEIHNQT